MIKELLNAESDESANEASPKAKRQKLDTLDTRDTQGTEGAGEEIEEQESQYDSDDTRGIIDYLMSEIRDVRELNVVQQMRINMLELNQSTLQNRAITFDGIVRCYMKMHDLEIKTVNDKVVTHTKYIDGHAALDAALGEALGAVLRSYHNAERQPPHTPVNESREQRIKQLAQVCKPWLQAIPEKIPIGFEAAGPLTKKWLQTRSPEDFEAAAEEIREAEPQAQKRRDDGAE
ncbi:hypothetical protein ACHAQH_004914 [Verticillium albo-atrum]